MRSFPSVIPRTHPIHALRYRTTAVARSSLYFIINYPLTLVMNKCFVFLNYSCKSWSNIKVRDSFKIWPWTLNLTKICLNYPRSKLKSNFKHYFGINLLSSTLIFSSKSWSNLTSSDSFGILRTSRFWNCPWFWYLTNICRSNSCHYCIHLDISYIMLHLCCFKGPELGL